jgi:hypothetical protein
MRTSLALATAICLVLLAALPTFAAEGDAGSVTIVKHACTEKSIKDPAEFDAIVAEANGDPVTELELTLLACPTIVLTANGDNRSDGAAGPTVDFALTVTDANGDSQTLADARFTPAKLCETDLDRDANGDGQKNADVCLDNSQYVFTDLAVGNVTIQETTPPNGWKFGSALLTPEALQPAGSEDSKTGATFDAKAATVKLDLAGDADNSALVHIFLFEDSPATDTLEPAGGDSPVPALALIAGLIVTLLVGINSVRRRAA